MFMAFPEASAMWSLPLQHCNSMSGHQVPLHFSIPKQAGRREEELHKHLEAGFVDTALADTVALGGCLHTLDFDHSFLAHTVAAVVGSLPGPDTRTMVAVVGDNSLAGIRRMLH